MRKSTTKPNKCLTPEPTSISALEIDCPQETASLVRVGKITSLVLKEADGETREVMALSSDKLGRKLKGSLEWTRPNKI